MTVAIVGTMVSAHRRDEYLQAARLAIEVSRIELELDLTPGIAIADALIADIDRDGDGSVSSREQRAFAANVLSAVELEVDGRPVQVQPLASTFPDLASIRRGEGTIRLQSSAIVPSQSVGAHHLLFRNTHRHDVGVYLANAVVPASNRVAITAQHRDRDQRELTIDYAVSDGPASATLLWLIVSVAGAVVMARLLRLTSRAS